MVEVRDFKWFFVVNRTLQEFNESIWSLKKKYMERLNKLFLLHLSMLKIQGMTCK